MKSVQSDEEVGDQELGKSVNENNVMDLTVSCLHHCCDESFYMTVLPPLQIFLLISFTFQGFHQLKRLDKKVLREVRFEISAFCVSSCSPT